MVHSVLWLKLSVSQYIYVSSACLFVCVTCVYVCDCWHIPTTGVRGHLQMLVLPIHLVCVKFLPCLPLHAHKTSRPVNPRGFSCSVHSSLHGSTGVTNVCRLARLFSVGSRDLTGLGPSCLHRRFLSRVTSPVLKELF